MALPTPFLSYAEALKLYAEGRKYKPLGTKLNSTVWLNVIGDTVTLGVITSKYYKNENGAYAKASTKERDKYTVETFCIIDEDNNATISWSTSTQVNAFLRNYGIAYRKSKTIKELGYEFIQFKLKMNSNYWSTPWDSTITNSVMTGYRIRIDTNGVMTSCDPCAVRTWDKEKQKALNAHIRSARRMLSLRSKLGAFSSFDFANSHSSPCPNVLSSPNVATEKISELIMNIKDDDYMTLVPLIWVAKNRSWMARRGNDTYAVLFDKLIAGERENLRKLHGAVSYVENNSTQEEAPSEGEEGQGPYVTETSGQS